MVKLLFFAQAALAALGWRVPWYFDCRHNSEWTHFKKALEVLGDVYQDEVFWWSQALLERIEPSFLRVQNTDHLYFLCDPNGTLKDDEWVPFQSDETSIFRLSTGTDQWTNEEQEERSYALGLGVAEQVRAASVCKDFQSYGDLCGWDARLLKLNAKHFTRVTLPMAGLPSPQIQEPEAFVQDFVAAFRDGMDAAVPQDPRIDAADLLLCTEPAFLCNAMARAFPDRPLVGYFANPLMAYLPPFHAEAWLTDFLSLSANQLAHRSAQFLAVASTRFLAEQVRFQTGAARVYAARPLAAYLGPVRGQSASGEVIVLRQPSMFWNSPCILNSMVRMNMEELESAFHAKSEGLRATSLRFIASEELVDGSSEAIASFEACVIFPYDVSQMRLYELYALAVPLFVPERRQLPSYIYRGLTTIEDFNHVLAAAGLGGKSWRSSEFVGPHLEYNPFDRSWLAADAWTQLTHWVSLPHLVRFASAAELLKRLVQEDLRRVTAAMRRQQTRDVLRASRFWTAALSHLDAPKTCAPARLLALQHHPDKNPDLQEEAGKKFQQITTAYETIMSHLKVAGTKN
eukprot:Skav229585  [mRNA]  locus=scaffold568:935109:938270:+ [translate_table: standard]